MITDPVDDRTRHRVAIVVFATVDAVDQTDADNVVRRALLEAVHRSTRRVNPGELPITLRWWPRNRTQLERGLHWDVAVQSLVELNRVVTGGHARLVPTDHAFPYDQSNDTEETDR